MNKTLKGIRKYAAQLATVTGKSHLIFRLPTHSGAYAMGYRYATCEEDERADYAADGAEFIN